MNDKEFSGFGFRKAFFGGYKPSDVDSVIDEMRLEIEKLQKENSELNDKINKFHEDEESIRKAIVSAQKLADSAVSEAKMRAEKISSDINSSIEKQKRELEKLKSDVRKFKNQIIEAYSKQIRNLKKDEFDLSFDSKRVSKLITDNFFEIKKNNEQKNENIIDVFDEVSSGTQSEKAIADEQSNLSKTQFIKGKLEFGNNYRSDNEKKSEGIFAGLFKNKKKHV